MWRLFVVITFFSWAAAPSQSHAVRIGFTYTGLVLNVGSDAPYDVAIPSFTPVSGQFIFDPDSTATHAIGASSTGYHHQIPSGFTADFQGASVVANDYIITVSDNLSQPGGQPSLDFFALQWTSDLNPALPSALQVNGVSQPIGDFSIDFSANSSLYQSTALPNSLDFADFSDGQNIGLFSDSDEGAIDVIFQVNSLQQIALPEPSSWCLAAIGIAGLFAYAGWSYRRSIGSAK